MAIEFNGKGKLNNFRIGKDVENTKENIREEKVTEQKPVIDNKFVKEVGEELLTSKMANVYGIKINKITGEKIDKDFWGDALNGLNLKETVVAKETVKGVVELDNAFAIADMEEKMAKSSFIQALNKEFGI